MKSAKPIRHWMSYIAVSLSSTDLDPASLTHILDRPNASGTPLVLYHAQTLHAKQVARICPLHISTE